MLLEFKETWKCLMAGQREAAASGRHEMSPEDLLLGLLEDESGVVVQAMRASGGASEVEGLIASLPCTGPEDSIGNELRASAKTLVILERAVTEASSTEHLYVQPGHILLAIVRDPACAGSQQLLELGVDLPHLDQLLVELVPRKTVDEDLVRQSSERFPRLTATQVRELAEQVSVWQQASRLLGDEHHSPVERRRLERLLTDTRGAWLRLQDHHRYLVWAAAKHCGAQGHDLAYVYEIATRVLTGACLSFSPLQSVPFDQYAKSYIAGRMEQLLDCDFEDDWDLQPQD